mgnify:CR=1 FL=1
MAIQRRQILAGLWATGGLVMWGLMGRAAHAYDVVITPSSPQLGDTISVVVQVRDSAAAPPTVVANGKSYPCFLLSNNRFRAFIPTSPLDPPGRIVIQVSGAEETRNLAVGLRDRTFRTQRINLRGSGSLGTDHEFDRVDEFKRLVSSERYWSGTLLRPSQGRVSSEYGVQRYYNGVFAENYYHRGVDYAAATGTPVVAPAAGYIRLVGRVSEGFDLPGNTIGIAHGQGLMSILLHLSRIDVNEGDFVRAGQRIGAIGSTGASTGPHLHWGLYVNQVAVDPVPWRYDGFE